MSSTSVLRRSLPALLALSALIGGAHVAHAQEILTDSPGSGFGSVARTQPVSTAFGFVLSDGPWNLFDISVSMGASLPGGGGPNTIAGSLWSDSGAGLPGTELVALSLTGGTVGTLISPLTFSPTGTVTLTAGTNYWFVARTGAPGILEFSLFGTNTGAHGNNLMTVGVRTGDGPWNSFIPTFPTIPVMTVRGVRPTGGNTGGGGNGGDPVPEPSEWAAMGALGLALGGLVVRKRRAA